MSDVMIHERWCPITPHDCDERRRAWESRQASPRARVWKIVPRSQPWGGYWAAARGSRQFIARSQRDAMIAAGVLLGQSSTMLTNDRGSLLAIERCLRCHLFSGNHAAGCSAARRYGRPRGPRL